MLSLDKITDNELYRVEGISLPAPMKKRLSELGLIKGTAVCRLFSAPCGSPTAYLVRGAQIAIRKEHARGITVSRI